MTVYIYMNYFERASRVTPSVLQKTFCFKKFQILLNCLIIDGTIVYRRKKFNIADINHFGVYIKKLKQAYSKHSLYLWISQVF